MVSSKPEIIQTTGQAGASLKEGKTQSLLLFKQAHPSSTNKASLGEERPSSLL